MASIRGGFFDQLGLSVTKQKKPQTARVASSPKVKSTSSRTKPKSNGTCEDCGLYKTCHSPKMLPSGEGQKHILICAEAPGETEDDEGVQLVGKSGHYLRNTLGAVDGDLDRDFWKTNALICRPPKNAKPTPAQLKICKPNLDSTIEKYKPNVLVLMGQSAFNSYMLPRLGGRITNVPYSDWIGSFIPDQETGMWICPVYHPSYLIREENMSRGQDKTLSNAYKDQFRTILELGNTPVPRIEYGDTATTFDEDIAVEWIHDLMIDRPAWVAFDYETTGLKPHRDGHDVRLISFCDGSKSRAFFNSEKVRKAWGDFLKWCPDHDVGVICHNISFEEMWSIECFNAPLDMKRWDTMLGAHCLNNRTSTQLKFLVYSQFGVLGYDEGVDRYITTLKAGEDSDSCNSFNRIDEADKEELIKYSWEDSFFTYELFKSQRRIFRKDSHINKGAQFFFESVKWMSRMQQNGVCVDIEDLERTKKKISHRLDCISSRIMASPAVSKWDKDTPFNFNSGSQLGHLLYDIMNVPVETTTASGKASTDAETLEKLDIPIVKEIVEHRHWSKVLKTYLGQYSREVANGIIHANFGLGRVDTFRSSSYNPNLQNVPKRNEEVKLLLRRMIHPRPGHRLIEYDYKSLEVIIAGCIFKDPNWITYCKDPSKDMHRDTAIEILYLDEKYDMGWDQIDPKIGKKCRQAAKNGFVFPSIYGSSGKNAAAGMWEQLPAEILKHLKAHKHIRNLDDFTDRMVAYDKDYWGKRYPVYDKTRHAIYDKYQRVGYIEQITGFRCYGPMSFMQVVNYPVQGPASHVKLKLLSEVSSAILEEHKDILPVMEIHDAIIFDVSPEDEAWLDRKVKYHGTQKVVEDWPWIICPLTIDKEESAVDGSWAEMSGCGYL